MALTPGLQLPYGIQPVVAVPVDAYLGPYSGSIGNDNTSGAVAAANAAISQALRYQSMEVHLIITGSAYKFWYKDGVADNNLVEFAPTSLSGSGIQTNPGGANTQVQFNDGGVFGGDANFVFDKNSNTLTVTNLTGSLTHISGGLSYLIAGDNVTITTSSNGQITIASSAGAGGGGSDPNAAYLVLSATGSLSAERTLFIGTGISGSDGGGGGSYSLSIDDSVVATVSGTTFTGATKHSAGLSGSLTQLVDGTSYLIAGTGITISSASNGSVTISSTVSGDITGVTAGTGLTGGGASGDVTLNIDNSVVATLTGSTFTGVVNFNQGLSGSLTKLTDGSDYVVAGASITVTTSSNGSITISSTAPAYNGGNGANNNILTADGSGGIVAESNLNFDGAALGITGSANISQNLVVGVPYEPGDTDPDAAILKVFKNTSVATDDSVSAYIENKLTNGSSDSTITGLRLFAENSLTSSIDVGVYGLSSIAVHNSVGNNNYFLIGTSGAGILSSSTAQNLGTVANVTGIAGLVGYYGNPAAGTITDGSAFEALKTGVTSTNTVTNSRGLRVYNMGGSGVTNAIGIDVSSQTGASTVNLGIRTQSPVVIGTTNVAGSEKLRVSGSSYFDDVAKFNNGLSGSLTKLADGTSYLIAGNNVSIATGTNGAVTISATSTASTPGGSDTYVQFNDGGTFGGDAGLTYNKTTDSLTVVGDVTGSGALFSKITVTGTASIAFLETINQTSLNIGDKYIVILSGAVDHAVLDGSGLLFGSGSIGPTVNELGANAHLRYRSATDSLEVFPNLTVTNDTSVSGNITGSFVVANSGFTGSLTRLTDGSPYLVAGDNVTLATSSQGAVTISAVTGSSYVFPNDLTVSLTGGKTFGRYASGETIPATGKTPAEVIMMSIAEPITPTVSLTGTNPITTAFNTTSLTGSITGSYTINSLGASISNAQLQWRSGSSGNWNVLSTSTTNPLKYDHALDVPAYFSQTINYQYIITDTLGAIATGSLTITPQSYSAPTVSLTVAATSPGSVTGETNTSREKGNVASTITGTITRNRANVPITSYSVQYQVNGTGGWTDVPGLSGVAVVGNPSSISIPSTSHNDVSLNTSNSLVYRVQVIDGFQTTTSSSTTVTFYNVIFYGPVSAVPTTSSDVRAITNKIFTNGSNPFTLNTGNTLKDFTVAMPATLSLSSVVDLDALNAVITGDYALSTFNVNDAGGTATSYKVYTLSIAGPYASNHRHQVTRA